MAFDNAGALAAGYSQNEIDQYLRSIQMTGAARYPAMAGSELLSGAETAASLPQRGLDWLGTNVFDPVATALGGKPVPPVGGLLAGPAGLQRLTDKAGLTNNPELMPGYGSYPAAEEVVAAAARGAGGAALLGPSAFLPGIVGGAIGEVTHQAFPNSNVLPVVAGGAAGLIGGGLLGGLRAPSVTDTYSGLTNELGAVGATPYKAGLEIQNELAKRNLLSSAGLGPATKLATADIKNIMGAKPIEVTDMVLKDPDIVQTLANEMPSTVSKIAGAMINRNPMQWNKLDPEVQDALLNENQQTALEGALKQAKGQTGDNSLWRYIVGGGAGVAASHLGLLPGGDIMGSIIGEAGAEMLHRTMTNSAARAILGPILNPGPMGFSGAGSAGLGAMTGARPGVVEPPSLFGAPQQ